MAVYEDEKTSDDLENSKVNSPSQPNAGYKQNFGYSAGQLKSSESGTTSSGNNASFSYNSSATSSNSGSSQNVSLSASQLNSAESGTTSSGNESGFSYSPGSTSSSGGIKNFFWGSKRRKQATVGGGLAGVGIGGGIFVLTLFGGASFEAIQISQLLTKLHFGSQQNLQDGEFVQLVRYAKDLPAGVIERSRMGYLGNKFADHYEGLLNESGLTSVYSDKFGLYDGLKVNTDAEGLSGLSGDDLKSAIAEKYGIPADNVAQVKDLTASGVNGLSSSLQPDDWLIEDATLHFGQTYQLTYGLLRNAGLNRLSSAIGARLFCVRAACDWHPLSQAVQNLKRLAEDYFKEDQAQEEDGQKALTPEDQGGSSSSQNPADATDSAAASGEASSIAAGAAEANADEAEVSSLSNNLAGQLGSVGKATAAGIAGLSLLCILNNLNKQVDSDEQNEVILPLIRMGMQAISTGQQVMDGQDVNAYELNDMASQYYGVDSEGQRTSWDDSESIQADLGNANTGQAPDGTLLSISNGSPFAFISNDIPEIGAVCSTAGQVVQGIIGFALNFSGVTALINQLAKSVVAGVGINAIASEAASWLAGRAVNVASVGADFGSDIDFGTKLAANQQALTAGGTALSSSDANVIQGNADQAYNQELQHQSLSTRLFSVDDPKSLISRIFADGTPTISGDFDSLVNHFTNITGMLADIPKLFSKTVDADSTVPEYDYPFPTYGFSEEDIDNPAVKNPYTNASYVESLLLNPQGTMISKTGEAYTGLAESCFGVTINLDSNDMLDVTAPAGGPIINPYAASYANLGCNQPTPADCTGNTFFPCNWLRVRFFILDTETENSMGCYAGDGEACSDIGF